MQSIQQDKFYYSFLNGAKEVTYNAQLLNQINVFPVADGDTGTNLSSLMNSIIHQSELKTDFELTLDGIAASAINGARGNSGMIFAQYILGLCNGLSQYKTMTIDALIHATELATDLAYKAVSQPVEGTILTAMKVFHISLKESDQPSILETLEVSHLAVQESVLNTTNQLDLLRKASVVDSGAKGFSYFVKGFIDGLKGHFVHIDKQETIAAIPHVNHDVISFRYCTEALIDRKDNYDYKKLLETLGDSIVTIDGKYKSRIHIHTDQPEEVFRQLSSTGTLLEQKVDDMIQQENIAHHRKYSTVIVTDSIADLPKDYIDQEQIYVINLNILIDDESYYDKLTITNDIVLNLKSKTHPKSSQPTTIQVENTLSYLLTYYENIVIIPVSKKLSGTFNVFEQVIKNLKSNRIALIDSTQNSVAQGLLVLMAAEQIKAGKHYNEVVDYLHSLIDQSKILVHVKTLKPMIDSGRLSVKVGRLLSKMRLRPIITLKEGQGHIEKIAFGNKNSMQRLLKYIASVHKKDSINNYAITYIDSRSEALDFAKALEKILSKPPMYIVQSSSIIAVGAGKGALAIGYLTERGEK